jgi:prepilin-type N-terminal cleavage/methylation domain-containing protein
MPHWGKLKHLIILHKFKLYLTINGYTLTELMVGMVISVMVIAFALANGMFFSNRYSYFTQSYMNTIDLVQLKADLERGVQNAEAVFVSDSTLTFQYIGRNPVSFTFSNEFVLRKVDLSVDTIKIRTQNLMTEIKPSTNLVSSFSLTINVSKPNRYIFTKEYPVATLVRYYISN